MIKLNGVPVVFEHYPDGESRWKPDDHGDCVVATVTLRYESDEDLIHLMLLKRDLDRMTDRTKLILTHVPYARMDRAAPGRCGFSLQYVAEFINWLGFRHVELRDPHSDVSAALFANAIEVSCMDALLTKVWEDSPLSQDETVLVFPDAGAQKKYERFIGPKTRFLIGSKVRNFEDGTIERLNVMGPAGLTVVGDDDNILIIDDLSSYGGTFIRVAEAVRRECQPKTVYLAVAHCEESARKGELSEHVSRVYTTDSMAPATSGSWMIRYSQDELLGRSGGV